MKPGGKKEEARKTSDPREKWVKKKRGGDSGESNFN